MESKVSKFCITQCPCGGISRIFIMCDRSMREHNQAVGGICLLRDVRATALSFALRFQGGSDFLSKKLQSIKVNIYNQKYVVWLCVL